MHGLVGEKLLENVGCCDVYRITFLRSADELFGR